MKTLPTKVYEISWRDGSFEWVTGRSRTSAISTYLDEYGLSSLRDLDIDGAKMTALSDEALHTHFVTDEDGSNKMSFYNWLQEYGEGMIAISFY